MSLAMWTGIVIVPIVTTIGVLALAIRIRRMRIRRRLQPRYAGNGPETVSGLSFESIVVPQPSAPFGFDATLPPSAVRAARQSSLQLPSGFDLEAFVASATRSFLQWRSAWRSGDHALLRQFTAGELIERVIAQLEARDPAGTRAAPAPDDVVAVEAELLALNQQGGAAPMASVRFKGLSGEQGGDRAQPFDEVWNLAQVVDGSRWVVAHLEPVRLAA
jgi:predicted lipid-binding transport protein (Tim44 family)